jgi:hypothetical protein
MLLPRGACHGPYFPYSGAVVNRPACTWLSHESSANSTPCTHHLVKPSLGYAVIKTRDLYWKVTVQAVLPDISRSLRAPGIDRLAGLPSGPRLLCRLRGEGGWWLVGWLVGYLVLCPSCPVCMGEDGCDVKHGGEEGGDRSAGFTCLFG